MRVVGPARFSNTFRLALAFHYTVLPPLTYPDLRYTLVVLVMFLLSSVLCPVLWYLWIHAGSANANFFFAMTITYALAQVMYMIAPTICLHVYIETEVK